jgi:ubiquinone/menaquinone biosynthesis C-methylase UbiE
VTRREPRATSREGWEGWDAYAPFYDWENARTIGRRDVPFWQRLAGSVSGRVLELGCGTGRIAIPVARAGARVVGVDRSGPMLDRARLRARRARLASRVSFVRCDIRELPFAADGSFDLVIAPYGILQSLLDGRDLTSVLHAVARVLRAGAPFAIDLVADLPDWQEYRKERRLAGWRSGGRSHVTLIESVRQDRRRGLTHFEQEYVERRPGMRRTSRRFDLTFRTISVARMARRLSASGFAVRQVHGDYDGGPWTPRSEVWLIVAERRS